MVYHKNNSFTFGRDDLTDLINVLFMGVAMQEDNIHIHTSAHKPLIGRNRRKHVSTAPECLDKVFVHRVQL